MPSSKVQMDEQLDEVKLMNKQIAFGKVIKVRDRQLLENNSLEKEYRNEQARIDKMMEISRIKGIIEEEEREVALVARKKQGQQNLIDQIQDRNYRRVLAGDEKERERQAVLAKVKQIT